MIGQKYSTLLARIQRLHAYIVVNPGCTQQQMCKHFGLGEHSVRKYLGILRDSKHVIKKDGARIQGGSEPSTYHATPKAAPQSVLPPRLRSTTVKIDVPVAQHTVRARQVGMFRDPLVEALFGPAVHA